MSIVLSIVIAFQNGVRSDREISLVGSLALMITNRPSRIFHTPSIAYEWEKRTRSEHDQFIKDQKYERQVELALAEVLCRLTGSLQAQRFFVKASALGLPSHDNLRFYDNFILSYDNRLKQPVWSFERLRKTDFRGLTARLPPKRSRLIPDQTIHELARANFQDYIGTEYDRCHLAALSNRRFNQDALDQSFRMTNTAPQATGLNQKGGVWYRLDGYVAFLAARTANAYVVTGTAYKPPRDLSDVRYRVIGLNRIAVPTHFYKAILSEDIMGKMSIEVFVIPNSQQITENERLEKFRIDVADLDELEEVIGLKFFDILDRSKIVKLTAYQYHYEEPSSKSI